MSYFRFVICKAFLPTCLGQWQALHPPVWRQLQDPSVWPLGGLLGWVPAQPGSCVAARDNGFLRINFDISLICKCKIYSLFIISTLLRSYLRKWGWNMAGRNRRRPLSKPCISEACMLGASHLLGWGHQDCYRASPLWGWGSWIPLSFAQDCLWNGVGCCLFP